MPLSEIPLDQLVPFGEGLDRPEDVVVDGSGRIFASDRASAVAEVLPDGRLRRIGTAGGEPNGIALPGDGTALIANFELGLLQRVDLESGRLMIVADSVEGRRLTHVNYPLVDSQGRIWVSCSTRTDIPQAVGTGVADGYLFRIDPGSPPVIVADAVQFPNCMTLDAAEEYLYVCRTSAGDVVRFPVTAAGGLGPQEAYGPPLGHRPAEEHGPEFASAVEQPEVMARWGMTDGCAFDAEGNLWVTVIAANRIVAITTERQVVTIVDDPQGEKVVWPTSIAWAGEDRRDLYLGSIAVRHLVRGRSPVPGSLPRGQ